MSTDSFSRNFDAIEVTPRALAPAESDEPGFALLDDAGGRFTIDRGTGVIRVAHADLLLTDAGAVFAVRVAVVEPSGESYQLRLKLRLTGLIPQVVGDGENDSLAMLARDLVESFTQQAGAPPRTAASRWPCLARLDREQARFGALLDPALPGVVLTEGALTLDAAPPLPAPACALWTVQTH